MRKSIFIFCLLAGCTGGGGSESNSTTEITNCVESDGMSDEQINELVAEAQDNAVPVEGQKNQEGNTIVVGCGGTFVDTNTETSIENNETNNELTRFIAGVRDGSIVALELR